MPSAATTLLDRLQQLDRDADNYGVLFVDELLAATRDAKASDVYLLPTPQGLELKWRLDGVIHLLGTVPGPGGERAIARLKVLAGLLTYVTETPQEGRIGGKGDEVDVRLSTFPTLHGERVVLRLLSSNAGRLAALDDLGLPNGTVDRLRASLLATNGAIVISGPAGSGKTTTAYAAVREIVRLSGGGRSVTSLEEPIEVAVDGVAQSEINDAVGFDMHTALRSLVRQDPDVILIGEMRDAVTASIAYQAALTGQLLITTFHAGSMGHAVARLLDLGVAAELICGATQAIVCQRLLRRLCTCGQEGDPAIDAAPLGLDVARCRRPAGCDACLGTGYAGQLAIAEMLPMEHHDIRAAILARRDAAELQSLARDRGGDTLPDMARAAIEAGQTTVAEVIRVLGLGRGVLPA